MFKPMKRRDYERWIRGYGWFLEKSGFDWTLHAEDGQRLCTIKISHPGNEVVATSVNKTKFQLKNRGLL